MRVCTWGLGTKLGLVLHMGPGDDGTRLGLVLAWFESCVLCLVFLDSSLQSPEQEKHFGIVFIPLCIVVREIQLCVQTWLKR